MLKFLSCLAALAFVAPLPVQAKTLKGPKIDQSFEIIQVSGNLATNQHSGGPTSHGLVYVKLIQYKGKVAVCGAVTGQDAKDNNYKYAQIGVEKPILKDLRFLQGLARFGRRVQLDAGNRGPVKTFTKSHKYGVGLPTKCKVTKEPWSPKYQSARPRIAFPVFEYIGQRKG